MFRPILAIKVIDESCVGCTLCVNVCPSDALSMQGPVKTQIAVLDAPRCVGCLKCAEQCIPYGAIEIVPNFEASELGFPAEEWDHAAVADLCGRARLDPEQVICICTGTTAAEVAAAVASGVTEPEDLVMATGVRALCGWLCVATTIRLLQAAGIRTDRPAKDYRIYADALEVGIWSIPEGVDEKYPEYRLKESLEAIEAGRLNEPAPMFPDILPGRRDA